MKNKLKFVSLFLAITMVLAVMPVNIFAATPILPTEIIVGSDEIEPSKVKEFTDLSGSGLPSGGGYSWDPETCTLTLKNYDLRNYTGGGKTVSIDAEEGATVTIKLVGDTYIQHNRVEYPCLALLGNANYIIENEGTFTGIADRQLVIYTEGSLTLKGGKYIMENNNSASLYVINNLTVKDAELDIDALADSALFSLNGDIKIDNSTINADSVKYSLFAYNGKIDIVENSNVTLNTTEPSASCIYSGKDLNINNSNVDAVSSSPIFSYSLNNINTIITDSNVTSNGDKLGTYTVKHMQRTNNDENKYYEVTDDTKQFAGKIGGLTAARVREYSGFAALPIEQKTILEDGSTVVEVKYNHSYKLNWDLDGGTAANKYTKGNVPFETTIIPPEVYKEGYTFDDWVGPTGLSAGIYEKMPDFDLHYKATWSKAPTNILEIPFTVNIENLGNTNPEEETFEFVVENLVSPTKYELLTKNFTVKNPKFVNGKASMDGTLQIKIVGELDEVGDMCKGFDVKIVKDDKEGWSYPTETWHVYESFERSISELDDHEEELIKYFQPRIYEKRGDSISEMSSDKMIFNLRFEKNTPKNSSEKSNITIIPNTATKTR